MGAGADLLALYWTGSGPVEVHVGREWSLFDWPDRCEQAARVGFSGIGGSRGSGPMLKYLPGYFFISAAPPSMST